MYKMTVFLRNHDKNLSKKTKSYLLILMTFFDILYTDSKYKKYFGGLI